MGNMFTIPDGTFTVVDPDDIARVAAEALDKLNFKGHSHVYVLSDLSGTDEIASLIGMEIGIPDLKWVKFPAEDFKKVLVSYASPTAPPTTMWRCLPPAILVFFLKTFRRPSLRSKERRSRSLRKPGRPRTAETGGGVGRNARRLSLTSAGGKMGAMM
jgi:hypothetical protein